VELGPIGSSAISKKFIVFRQLLNHFHWTFTVGSPHNFPNFSRPAHLKKQFKDFLIVLKFKASFELKASMGTL